MRGLLGVLGIFASFAVLLGAVDLLEGAVLAIHKHESAIHGGWFVLLLVAGVFTLGALIGHGAERDGE